MFDREDKAFVKYVLLPSFIKGVVLLITALGVIYVIDWCLWEYW